MIRAILRAQWLSMRFGWGRRGLAIVAGLLWYGLWAFVALAVGLALADASPAELRLYLPTGLLGVCAYWQLMPVLSASMGSALELRKLIVYPIPHAKLFAIEVLLRLTTASRCSSSSWPAPSASPRIPRPAAAPRSRASRSRSRS
jgi:hypothetical protein